ncbi:bifunctional diaminohydroxyphosphoribosylaminopyrimidine deaminase/5-amino-6-(5-phosphoribosylamino)uracil reductase RibD [Aquabacter spiritensis]|uniref:diaminohydroxyphosphoribosylaminopyrimidine deaminase n=1 Tax=Aquabacter spiritensis TaxID=933073 RepID=A0A4R3LWI2_9HYPH|nr:bifunctional diaminohydroxyphosphoribosylaminopyrimidine deaminase/5-amino-6-(5-phosphoribosylamino)uracil reductase RibD [Aquabacter spiritensis]TCT04990.1 diaminohydroxyphosphoribosylaminopyrimidine deaminase [Aquabacter spiritensis]
MTVPLIRDRSPPAAGPHAADAAFMHGAIALARAQMGRVWPNPAVGCILVADGQVVGRGATQDGGRPHAETVALESAGPRARGATAYVSLEPCSHWGHTPPCADRLIAAGVRVVHVALRDPYPAVDGAGLRRLAAAGIAVSLGLGAAAARDVVAGFFTRVATGAPLIRRVRPAARWPGRPEVPPLGFDALARSLPDGRTVRLTAQIPFARARDVTGIAGCACCERGADHAAGHDFDLPLGEGGDDLRFAMGRLGLTRVAVRADDPLAARLARQSGPIGDAPHAANGPSGDPLTAFRRTPPWP